MQTPSLPLSGAFSAATRFTPPAHVKRWTGRAALTIRLPDLAALRIAASPSSPAQLRPVRA